MPFNGHQRISLLVLLLAGLVLKFLWLGNNELSHDEPFTVVMAHRDLADLFAAMASENNPPLHFLLMHFWVGMVPLDEAWLRLPSALFSALTVLPLYLIGSKLGGTRVAWTASLLFLFSNYHYAFAHEVRAYSLFALLATTSMWLLIRGFGTGPAKRYSWLLLALVNVMLVYTHFFGWLLIGVQATCVLLLDGLRDQRTFFFRSLLATVIGFAPYAGLFALRLGTSVEQGTWLTAPDPEELYNMIWRWSNAPVVAVLSLLLIVFAAARTRAKGLAMGLPLLWTFVPLFGMFTVSFSVPMFLDRYLVYAAPGFALLLGVSSRNTGLRGRWSNLPGALIVTGMALSFTPWKTNGLRPSMVVSQCEAWRDDGPVFIHPTYYADTYAWHLDRQLVTEPKDLRENLEARRVYLLHSIQDLRTMEISAPQLVLVVAGSSEEDPARSTANVLGPEYSISGSLEADHKVWVHRVAR